MENGAEKDLEDKKGPKGPLNQCFNKLASLEATLVRNFANPPIYRLTAGVKCKAGDGFPPRCTRFSILKRETL